jgi:hypothetical protein
VLIVAHPGELPGALAAVVPVAVADDAVTTGLRRWGRHNPWRADSGVSQHSNLAYEREIPSRASELGAAVDGIDLKNIVIMKAYVAAELSREAAIQKEKMKAREARPQPKPKGKKGGSTGGTAPGE